MVNQALHEFRYALKLRSIDMMRENGSFHDEDGLIPEGML